ncbi:MAG: DDE-type integrase/transposase/recombinase, partial [Pseudomonadota bacterium]
RLSPTSPGNHHPNGSEADNALTIKLDQSDEAAQYRRVILEINHRYDPHFNNIRHIDRKWRNKLIDSDHAALKRLLGYRQSFRSLRSVKATLSGIETIRTIRPGHIQHKQQGVQGEIMFINQLFNAA